MEERRKLQIFLEDVCSGPLKEMLIKCAKYDQRVTHTTSACLQSDGAETAINQSDLNMEVFMKGELERIIFENDTEKKSLQSHYGADDQNATVEKPNVSLLISLIKTYFIHCLATVEKLLIAKIEDIINNIVLGHESDSLSEGDVEYLVNEIQSAALTLADKANDNPRFRDLPRSIDERRRTLFPNLQKRKSDNQVDDYEQMKNGIDDIKKSTATAKKILRTVTVTTTPKRIGMVNKRMKTVDCILGQMHARIKVTFDQELSEYFNPPPEVELVISKLRENHCVVVTGFDSKLYLATALSAIRDMNFTFTRCVEMTKLSDWRHVDPEDVDLVLFREPFNQTTGGERELLNVLDSMKYSADDNDVNNISVVIVSGMAEVEEWKALHYHDLLEEIVTVKQPPTTEQTPIDLTASKDPSEDTHPILRNMIDQTDVFRRNVEKYASFTDTEDFCKAKELFKKYKSVLILGKKNNGKTTLAVQLMSPYSAGQCLIITDPSEWKHARLGAISVVIIEDFAGKYSYDKKFASAWLTKFDQIYAAVQQGKVSVIITCGKGQYEKFSKRFSTHPLIEHQVNMTSEMFVKEEPMSPLSMQEDELVADSTCSVSEDAMETASPYTGDSDYTRLQTEVDSWETCLQSHSESVASCLLEKNKVPNKSQLEEIAKIFEGKQKSSVMRKCCSKISENIKSLSEKIIDVWPAYRIDGNGKAHIAFVICTNEDIDLKNKLKYEYTIRVIGKCSTEARDVTVSKENIRYKMSSDDAKKIKAFIAKNSRELLKRHSMLSGISASSIKSKNYGTNKWVKVPCPCVVFYVHTKNYIPLDEDPFEKEYDGISVDVREGAFTRFGRDGHCSTKYQPDVKIACEIRGANSSGTLSGFLELPGSKDIFGFTCAHSVLSTDVLSKNLAKNCNNSFHLQRANADEILGSMVYQPANSEEVLGNVVQVAYQEGENGTSGMEIAIIKLQKARYPISGKISDFEREANEHTFETGKVAERASIQYGEDVVKFGSTSGISQGRIAFDGATVREITLPWNNDGCFIILHNQLEVWPCNFQEKFADKGDSGAPVFVSRDDELNCVGIVEGGYDNGNCVVTPVDGLLRELDILSLKDFREGHSTKMETSETANIKLDVLPRHERERKYSGRRKVTVSQC